MSDLPLTAIGPDSTDRPFIRDAHRKAMQERAELQPRCPKCGNRRVMGNPRNGYVCVNQPCRHRFDRFDVLACDMNAVDAGQGPYAERTAELARDLCGRLDALHSELRKEASC